MNNLDNGLRDNLDGVNVYPQIKAAPLYQLDAAISSNHEDKVKDLLLSGVEPDEGSLKLALTTSSISIEIIKKLLIAGAKVNKSHFEEAIYQRQSREILELLLKQEIGYTLADDYLVRILYPQDVVHSLEKYLTS